MLGYIGGKYCIKDKLGEGFGGAVFLVESEGSPLALKQLRMRTDHECLSPEEILDNFKQEFSTLKTLHHPHILRILDFGYDREENFHYFTTEYIRGQDLFGASHELDPGEIEDLIVQTLRALSYLHSQRIYHLDIKPSNILVERTAGGKPVAKLIDFGLSAFRKRGFLAGSPAYMSPETLVGAVPDGRSDLYSLGVTWYKCLNGVNPFEADDMAQILSLQRSWMPPPISSQSSQIPPYLDSILEKMLKKNPAERYHRADQVIRDINWKGGKSYPLETEATALAYLPGEGRLVGRQGEWDQLLKLFDRVFVESSDHQLAAVVSGDAGIGKSRLLRELKYHAQLRNIPVYDLASEDLSELKPHGVLLWDNVGQEDLKRIDNILRQFHRDPFLILAAGRNLRLGFGSPTEITLRSFNREQVAEYVASVLGMNEPPDFFIDQLHSRTEGNPLYLTELLQSLIQSHQIFDNQGRWSPALLKAIGVDFSRLPAPPTLREFCRSKYCQLSDTAKQILILLAVSKVPINRSLLVKTGIGGHRDALELLQEEGLASVDPTNGEINLVNPSMRELVCADADPATLAKTHQTLGDWFSTVKDREPLAWYHLGFGTGSKAERYQSLLRHGDALMSRLQPLAAIEALDAAAGIAPSQENRVDAQLKKCRALFLSGSHQEALKLLEALRGVLRAERENPKHWKWVQQTYHEMCHIFLRAGRLDLAKESLHIMQVLLEEHDNEPVEQMILENFRVSLLLREGHFKEAEAIAEEANRNWEQLDFETKKLVSNNELAWVYLAQKKAQQAKTLLQTEASFYQAVGNINKRAYAIYGWAESCCQLKQFDEATRIYQYCIELSRELKNEELLMNAYIGLGNVDYLQKNWEGCSEQYQKALELAQRQSNASDSVLAIELNLGIAYRHLHDPTNALLYLHHVATILAEQNPLSHKQTQLMMTAHLELGRVHENLKQWIDARDAFREALRMARFCHSFKSSRVAASLGIIRTAMLLHRGKEAQAVLSSLEKEHLSALHATRIEETKRLLFQNVDDPEILEREASKFQESKTNTFSFKAYF